MSTALDAKEWLGFVKKEYLDSFVKEGGAAIKFAVLPDEQALRLVCESLGQTARNLGYVVTHLNASEAKIHMADQIFFRVADQIPWQRLTQRVIAKLAEASEADEPSVEQIARAFRVERLDLQLELRPKIVKRVFKNRELSKDFRVAMTHLCQAEIAGGQDGALTIQTLTDWLTGRNNSVGAVKPYQIFSRINRTNARFLFESLLRWVRFAGFPGLVIIWDIRRLAVPKNPHDDLIYYSKAAVLDAYEVLRQFLDGTDRLEGCLMIVLPDMTFLDDYSRGVHAYEALKFRVFDEIRDRILVNPMGCLVRLWNVRRAS